MRCPFCGDAGTLFALPPLFTVVDPRLRAFCPACRETLRRAAERKATQTHYTFSECLDRYLAAVRSAFDETPRVEAVAREG